MVSLVDTLLPERYLVLGGAGFLGSYIVDALVARGERHIFVFDLKEPAEHYRNAQAQYYVGDLCDMTRLVNVLQKTQPTCVFHTISPIHGSPDGVQIRVNIDGTRTLLEACRHSPVSGMVKKIVYTSSTGVVWKVRDIRGASEENIQPPSQGYDSYHHSKAVAEKLVLAEDSNNMHTVVLRPCGMIGPRDQQLMHRLDQVLRDGQHKVQIGDNNNLTDWAYVGNVADAHILAADRLPNAHDPDARNRPHPVAGQVFFVTNGTPMPGWDFSRMVYRELGAPPQDLDPSNTIKIPRWLALIFAHIAELFCKVLGTSTEFTVFTVQYSTAIQWYNIDKARKALSYEPRVGLAEAVSMTVTWWKERGAAEYAASKHTAK